jgi:hypothetical protein
MSLSPLLTITEWHGFRALVAAIIALISVVRLLAHGLRNLACNWKSFAGPNNSPTFWARVRSIDDGLARQVPVLWFDNGRGREGPTFAVPRLQPLPIVCNPNRSFSIPLVICRPEPGFGSPRQQD